MKFSTLVIFAICHLFVLNVGAQSRGDGGCEKSSRRVRDASSSFLAVSILPTICQFSTLNIMAESYSAHLDSRREVRRCQTGNQNGVCSKRQELPV